MVLGLFSGRSRPDPQRIRRVAMGFPMAPVLDRYCAEFDASIDQARVYERELKRFFMLSALHPDRPYGMKGPVDGLWHVFLWFTEAYHELSRRLMGPRRFLHHHPCTTHGGEIYPITYDLFWYDYEDAFGEPPPADVWPPPEGPRRGWKEIQNEIAEYRAKKDPRPDGVAGAGGCGIYYGCGGGDVGGGSDGASGGGFGGGGCGGGGCGGGGCGGGG